MDGSIRGVPAGIVFCSALCSLSGIGTVAFGADPDCGGFQHGSIVGALPDSSSLVRVELADKGGFLLRFFSGLYAYSLQIELLVDDCLFPMGVSC